MGILAVAIIAPWLFLLPTSSGVLAVLFGATTLAAALHGLGLVVAYSVRAGDTNPVLVIHWGLAVAILVGGLAMALRSYGIAVQSILVFVGAALHSGFLIHQFSRRADRLAASIRSGGGRYAAPAWILLAIVGAIHLLGAAGDVAARPFDEDGNHLAQLQRLLDTGTLGDAIGFTRSAQLGGQLSLEALVQVVASRELVRLLDGGLGFVLLLALVLTRLRPTDAASGLWAVLLVLVAASLPIVAPDASLRWLSASALLALYTSLDRDQPTSVVPVALLAGAIATLRYELVPVAAIALLGAWWLRRRDLRTLLGMFAIALAVVSPYLLVAISARSSLGTAAALVTSPRSPLIPLVLFGGATLIAVAASRLVTDRTRRWIVVATLAGIAGIVCAATGTRGSVFLAPIVVAGGLALLTEVITTHRDTTLVRPALLILSLLGCVSIYEARESPGRVRWSRRYLELLQNVELVRAMPTVPAPASPYRALLDQVPAGARVAVWVNRPELLDYGTHELFDLRSPRVVRRTLAQLLDRLDARYLLIELDHRPLARAQKDPVYRLVCADRSYPGFCGGDLESLVSDHILVGSHDHVRLVSLQPR